MEVITTEAVVFTLIMDRLKKLEQLITEKKRLYPLTEVWLDINETTALLKVSKRTLQAYRDNGIISFSQFGGKIYFKGSDIEDHLKKHYVKAFRK